MTSFTHSGSTFEKGVYIRNMQNLNLYLLPHTAHRYDVQLLRYLHLKQFLTSFLRIFPEPEVLSSRFEKPFLLFTFYTSCANFSYLALIVASESWCEKNNNNNNSEEGTAESVTGQRAVAPLTLIITSTRMTYKSHTTSSINFEGLQMKLKTNKNNLSQIWCIF